MSPIVEAVYVLSASSRPKLIADLDFLRKCGNKKFDESARTLLDYALKEGTVNRKEYVRLKAWTYIWRHNECTRHHEVPETKSCHASVL